MANCRRTRGGIFGWTASRIFSNSARVITVLQFWSAALSAGGFGHAPLIVITGVSGGTFEASASFVSAGFAAGFPAGRVDKVGVGVAAWPHAIAAKSRQTKPYRVIFNDSSREDRKGQ